MFNIPTIEDYYRGTADQFGRDLSGKGISSLAEADVDELVRSFLEEWGLPYSEIEIDPAKKPVLRRTSEGTFLSVEVKPQSRSIMRLMEGQRVCPNPFSCSFSPSRLRADSSAGTLIYPSSDSPEGAKSAHADLVEFVTNLNTNIREQAPRFVQVMKSKATAAVESAKREVERRRALGDETGFDVIDET